MTQIKHTPGPYYYDGECVRAQTKDAGEVTIATVRGWMKQYRDEEYANGLLLAVAPEMFGELVRAEEILRINDFTDHADRIAALLAKATGGQK